MTRIGRTSRRVIVSSGILLAASGLAGPRPVAAGCGRAQRGREAATREAGLASEKATGSVVAAKPDTVIVVEPTRGVQFFRPGDSITITEVKATSPDLKAGDKVIVKGHYTLASEPKASLCLFATATKGSGKSTNSSRTDNRHHQGTGRI